MRENWRGNWPERSPAMKRDRGTNVFSLIVKSIYESTAGRIRWRRNMWALSGSRWDNHRIGGFERDGHSLVKKRCTLCPSAPGNDFYFDGKWWWVPAVVCRKCQWHRPSGRNGFRFPRCIYKKTDDPASVAATTLVQVSDMVKRATQDAEEIVKGNLK